jgi:hypothetical protein
MIVGHLDGPGTKAGGATRWSDPCFIGLQGCFMVSFRFFRFMVHAAVLLASPLAAAKTPSFVYSINGTSADSYNVKTIFVDLFDASTARISKLKQQQKTVICYFSAGSAEDWRQDYKKYPAAALGKPMDGWAGENWVDYRNATVLQILRDRIALAKSKGCQGVDPDNVDGHLNKTGFSLTARNQRDFIEQLSTSAHSQGLSIGLKNSAETAWDLERLTDFVVVEECSKYSECSKYKAFQNNRKPIYQIEYRSKNDALCKDAAKREAFLVFANLALTKFQFCN